jgi:D-xylose transport system permease protein
MSATALSSGPKDVTTTTDPAVPLRARSLEQRTWRLLVLLAIVAVTWAAFHVLTDQVFFTARNLSNLSVQMSITALLAVGMTWLLVAREIDLSVGSLLALVSVVVVALQVESAWPTGAVVAVGLVIGALVGALQGSFTVAFAVPSFIVTLAGFSWLRGTGFVVSGAETRSGTNDGFYEIANGTLAPGLAVGLCAVLGVAAAVLWLRDRVRSGPGWLARLRPVDVAAAAAFVAVLIVAAWAFGSFQGLPYPVLVLAAVVAAAMYTTRHTAFGRHIYAIGGNPEAARRAGIGVRRVTVMLFVVSGTLAALGGIMQASRLDAGPPGVGQFLALDAISAAIVGGTSLFGGQGSIAGAMLGALLMATIANGLSLMGVDTFYQLIATGLVLMAAVAFDTAARRRASA